jgi:hypothetical protein
MIELRGNGHKTPENPAAHGRALAARISKSQHRDGLCWFATPLSTNIPIAVIRPRECPSSDGEWHDVPASEQPANQRGSTLAVTSVFLLTLKAGRSTTYVRLTQATAMAMARGNVAFGSIQSPENALAES